MKKTIFKRLLSIVDSIELFVASKDDTNQAIIEQLEKENGKLSQYDIPKAMSFAWTYTLIKEMQGGIDLTPCATIFAKADSNSRIEAISLFECIYRNVEMRSFFHMLLQQKIRKSDIHLYIDDICFSLLTQTSLFHTDDTYVILRKDYCNDIQSIITEYENGSPLLSVTLCALYTTSIIAHENTSLNYKNQGNPIVSYPLLTTILTILPRLGVPSDRNETKALQAFYKDTLFHECEHACPICGIDIPHLLVASHIKPFRDCAHIYEAIDHNNGLLLCRNHDFLFDRGYISFQDDGTICISKELYEKHNDFAFALTSEYKLPSILLSLERRLFLRYHRDFIFMG